MNARHRIPLICFSVAVLGLLVAWTVLREGSHSNRPAASVAQEPLESSPSATAPKTAALRAAAPTLATTNAPEPGALDAARQLYSDSFAASIEVQVASAPSPGGPPAQDLESFELLLVDEDGDAVSIQTFENRWNGRLRSSKRYTVAAITSASSAYEHDAPTIAVDRPQIVVEARSAERWILEVVDGETGDPLESVTVDWLSQPTQEASASAAFSSTASSANERSLAVDESSPLELQGVASGGSFRVRAPDYAPLEFRRSASERLTRLRLTKAGSLEVRIALALTNHDAPRSLQVRADGGGVVHSEPLAGTPVHRIEAIPIGRYFVSIESTPARGVRIPLFELPAAVLPGETTVVSLPSPGAVEPSSVRLALSMPSRDPDTRAWTAKILPLDDDRRQASVDLGRVEAWTPLGNGSVLESPQVELQPGRYRATITPLGYQETFEVRRPTEQILIELDNLASVTVALDGQADDAKVTWSYVDPPAGPYRVQAGSPAGAVAFLCSPRTIRIQAIGPQASSESIETTPAPGEVVALTLLLRPSDQARLTLTLWNRHGRQSLSPSEWSDLVVTPTEGDGSLSEVRFGRGPLARYGTTQGPDWSTADLVFDRAGRYQIELPSHGIDVVATVGAEPGRLDLMLE